MSQACDAVIAAALYLESAGMTGHQLTRLHHFSISGRKVSFAETYRYFEHPKQLRLNNLRFAERLVFVADEHRRGGRELDAIIDEARRRWPLEMAVPNRR